ncbi:MAG: MFS transporter [Coriobacteriia bacterium]|nr:MFS transporter [Coriobacteriia bacterium]
MDAALGVRRTYAIFANLIATCVALGLMSTAMSTALAPMTADLGVDVSCGQWVTSGYALALAMVMPLTAFLVTRFPSKPLYLTAVGAYAVASACCALAPSFALLMVARVVQACMNGVIANLTQVSILSLFEPGARGRTMGWFGLSQGAAVVMGPTVGGLLVDVLGWRAVFAGVAVLCLASFAAACATLRNLLPTSDKPFDPLSFVLSVVGFGGLTLGLGNAVSCGASPLVLGSLAAGLAAAVLFVRRQLSLVDPFLKVQLLRVPAYGLAVACSAVLYACAIGSSAVLPLQVQLGLGQPAAAAGLVVLPGAVALALVNPLSGRAFDRFGMGPLCVAGAAMLVLANAACCLPAVYGSAGLLCVANVVRCVGVGMLQMPLVTWANSVIRPEDMPHGSALLTALRNVAGALGVAVLVAAFQLAGPVAAFGTMAGISVCLLLPVLTSAKGR